MPHTLRQKYVDFIIIIILRSKLAESPQAFWFFNYQFAECHCPFGLELLWVHPRAHLLSLSFGKMYYWWSFLLSIELGSDFKLVGNDRLLGKCGNQCLTIWGTLVCNKYD